MRVDDERIMERYRHPHMRGFEGSHDGAATGDNPFCGDSVEVRVSVGRRADGEPVIEHAAFDGYACSLCTASADLLLEGVLGMEVAAASTLTGDDVLRWWGGLEVGRTRRGCVDLPVSVLGRALEDALERCGKSLLQ